MNCRFPIADRRFPRALQSAIANRQSAVFRPAFTLIEMLTTVAVLIIVLGLMVSLARYVRDRSAQQLTRNLLRQLDRLMGEYVAANEQSLPAVAALIPPSLPLADEETIQNRASLNNQDFVRALRQRIALALRSAAAQTNDRAQQRLGELPVWAYDEVSLRDAWGSPIVFMPHEHPRIGMAPRGRPSFFFSAGPDGKYLSRDDNLYSYETPSLPAGN
jgi:type II secretory pathway pseudopilin PulG